MAYSLFLALPATLLLSLGLFSLLAGPSAVDTVMERVATVVPAEAVSLIDESLTRVVENQEGALALLVVGGIVALWSATGAMQTLMSAVNHAYERQETRGFLKKRLTALAMLALGVVAFGLVMGLLVLGPHVSEWVGEAVGLEGLVGWLWWAAQWPIVIGGLLALFAGILYLAPDIEHRRFSIITPGTVLAVVVWLAASGLFAIYVSLFGSYNKAWGSLAAVIIMLTWLWLSALAFLLGAEVNAEVERSHELRAGRAGRARAASTGPRLERRRRARTTKPAGGAPQRPRQAHRAFASASPVAGGSDPAYPPRPGAARARGSGPARADPRRGGWTGRLGALRRRARGHRRATARSSHGTSGNDRVGYVAGSRNRTRSSDTRGARRVAAPACSCDAEARAFGVPGFESSA